MTESLNAPALLEWKCDHYAEETIVTIGGDEIILRHEGNPKKWQMVGELIAAVPDLVKAMEGQVELGRYEKICEVSPSGKTLFRCTVCGDVTPAPCKFPYHTCNFDWATSGCKSEQVVRSTV